MALLDFSLEQTLHAKGYPHVAGVDEVGRGPWAGPVVAAAVVLPDDINLSLLASVTDSKKISAKKREALYEVIYAHAHVGVGEASVVEIDQHNILQATFMAMVRAVAALPAPADYALIDGNKVPSQLAVPAASVIKGDGKVLSIACASIIAKVYRDRLMASLAEQHPHFGWETNAGYGTAQHQEGLKQVGVTPHHRRSFKPIRAYLP